MDDGVAGVGMLVIEDCAECPPNLDCARLWRFCIGPPVSETGSRDEGKRSCPRGRGNLEFTGGDGLLVKVSDMAAFGREGLLLRLDFILMFRFTVSLLELNTSPSPISRPVRKLSLKAAFWGDSFSPDCFSVRCFSWLSSGLCSGEIVC